jgi:hypothetical protein
MGGECSTDGSGKNCAYNILLGKPEGKNPLGRPRLRLEHNITVDITEIS